MHLCKLGIIFELVQPYLFGRKGARIQKSFQDMSPSEADISWQDKRHRECGRDKTASHIL